MKVLILALFALAHMCSAVRISQDEFNRAIKAQGAPIPPYNVYQNFADATQDYSREEIAMFMAQLIHESGSFRYREDIVCQTGNHCDGHYVDNIGFRGRNYYGRGFIQLTWAANYKAVSEALGLGNYLLQYPEVVARDTKIAMLASKWYWEARVRPQMAGRENQFGVTTKAINGGLECSGGWNQQAANRYQIYLKVADALGVQNKAVENGCYN